MYFCLVTYFIQMGVYIHVLYQLVIFVMLRRLILLSKEPTLIFMYDQNTSIPFILHLFFYFHCKRYIMYTSLTAKHPKTCHVSCYEILLVNHRIVTRRSRHYHCRRAASRQMTCDGDKKRENHNICTFGEAIGLPLSVISLHHCTSSVTFLSPCRFFILFE